MKIKKIIYDDVERHRMIEGFFFTEDELYEFVNDCMQRKATFDGTNFTPMYEVQTYLSEVIEK